MKKFKVLISYISLLAMLIGIIPTYAAEISKKIFDESFKYANGFIKVSDWNTDLTIKDESCHIVNRTQTVWENYERSFEAQNGLVNFEMTVKIDGMADLHGLVFYSSSNKEVGSMYISQTDNKPKLIFKVGSRQGENFIVEAPGNMDFKNWTVVHVEFDFSSNQYTGWFGDQRPDNLKTAKLFTQEKMNLSKISFTARPTEGGALGYYLKNIKLSSDELSDVKTDGTQPKPEDPQGLLPLPAGFTPFFEDIFNYPDGARNKLDWSATLRVKDKAIYVANSGGGQTENFSRYFANDSGFAGKVYVDFTVKVVGLNTTHSIGFYSNKIGRAHV